MSSYQKDKQQLVTLGKSLLAARTPSSSSSSSDDYYKARQDYERERLKTSVLAPLLGGFLGDLIAAPFKEPLIKFSETEKGAKLFADHSLIRNQYNKLMSTTEDIAQSKKPPEQYYYDRHIQEREDQLQTQFGANWRNNPVVYNAELMSYDGEAREAARLDTEQYNKVREIFKDGFPDIETFARKAERFNPRSSNFVQAGYRALGRLFRGESSEEYTDRMINNITGGPDSPFGIDHQELSTLVNEAIYLDDTSLTTFIDKAKGVFNSRVEPVLRVQAEFAQNQQEQAMSILTLFRAGAYNQIESQVVYDLMEADSTLKNLSSRKLMDGVAEKLKIPALTAEVRSFILPELASQEFFTIREEVKDFLLKNHPAFAEDSSYPVGESQDNILEGLEMSFLNSVIDRSYYLAQQQIMQDGGNNPAAAAFYETAENLKPQFMQALLVQQIPKVFERHLEYMTSSTIEGKNWIGLGGTEVEQQIATGELLSVFNLGAIENEMTVQSEIPSERGPGLNVITGDSDRDADNLTRVNAEVLSEEMTNGIITGENTAMERAKELIDRSSDIVGDNPYLFPYSPDTYTYQSALSSGFATDPDALKTDFIKEASGIRQFPFEPSDEEITLSNGAVISATLTNRAGQYNFKALHEVQDSSMYGPKQGIPPTASISAITFEDLENGPFKFNTMWASNVYHDYERLAEVADDPLKKRFYEEGMKNTLQKFDFSYLPFRTNTKQAEVFLRDAYKAYQRTENSWEADQIDEAGNTMGSPPSLLEPDNDNDFTGETFNLLNSIGEQATRERVRPETVAALMGNISVETGNTFDYQQVQNQGGPGYGLFQLDDKKANYDTWLEENDKQDSAASQIDFVYDTIYGDAQDVIGIPTAKRLRDVFETGTVEEIATAFMELWEKPNPDSTHLDRRIEEAKSYFDLFDF